MATDLNERRWQAINEIIGKFVVNGDWETTKARHGLAPTDPAKSAVPAQRWMQDQIGGVREYPSRRWWWSDGTLSESPATTTLEDCIAKGDIELDGPPPNGRPLAKQTGKASESKSEKDLLIEQLRADLAAMTRERDELRAQPRTRVFVYKHDDDHRRGTDIAYRFNPDGTGAYWAHGKPSENPIEAKNTIAKCAADPTLRELQPHEFDELPNVLPEAKPKRRPRAKKRAKKGGRR